MPPATPTSRIAAARDRSYARVRRRVAAWWQSDHDELLLDCAGTEAVVDSVRYANKVAWSDGVMRSHLRAANMLFGVIPPLRRRLLTCGSFEALLRDEAPVDDAVIDGYLRARVALYGAARDAVLACDGPYLCRVYRSLPTLWAHDDEVALLQRDVLQQYAQARR